MAEKKKILYIRLVYFVAVMIGLRECSRAAYISEEV